VLTIGAINITQLPGESGEDLADRMIRRLERLGVLQTGSTTAFGPSDLGSGW
jgi:hypothetical protein